MSKWVSELLSEQVTEEGNEYERDQGGGKGERGRKGGKE